LALTIESPVWKAVRAPAPWRFGDTQGFASLPQAGEVANG
jgi:nitrogenase molybdenum-cofactor synthesis protein NifE